VAAEAQGMQVQLILAVQVVEVQVQTMPLARQVQADKASPVVEQIK
jgi:hypothetical protein